MHSFTHRIGEPMCFGELGTILATLGLRATSNCDARAVSDLAESNTAG